MYAKSNIIYNRFLVSLFYFIAYISFSSHVYTPNDFYAFQNEFETSIKKHYIWN